MKRVSGLIRRSGEGAWLTDRLLSVRVLDSACHGRGQGADRVYPALRLLALDRGWLI